jgi:hypothetical protein
VSIEATAAEKKRFHEKMLALGAVIGLDAGQLPKTADDVSYDCLWVDVTGQAPHFVYSYRYRERGDVTVLAESPSIEDVLESIFADATQPAATTFELDHRIAGQDSRRQWFALQAEMMDRLDLEWGRRMRANQNIILQTAPFNDKT